MWLLDANMPAQLDRMAQTFSRESSELRGPDKVCAIHRSEEAIGSATDIWVAFREGRFGKSAAPFLGYFFLLEDCDRVRTHVRNKEPYFKVDPVFDKASYSRRYELLCRRLVLERVYTAASLVMATNSRKTAITQPAEDLSFKRFVAALRGHAVTFLGSRKSKN